MIFHCSFRLIYCLSMGDGIAIGIDLGTTHCSIAVFRNNKVELIPNEHGSRITPSCVAFTDKGMLIGETAENQAVRNYRNTVIDVKRLIGPKFDDISIQSDQKYWPFTVLSSDTGYPQVQVELKGVEGSFTPEEITTMILLKLKQTAEKFLGSRVTKAVVSVPAYFNEAQRRATKDAGAIAGLNVMKVVNGAALAATAYCFDKKRDGERNILVFDLGGGSLSVALVTFEEEIIQVKSVAGNNHLGGEDFTNRMVDHFVDEVKRKHNKDISADKRAMHRLRIVCERAKWNLSSSEQQSIEVDSLAKGIDFHSTITRRRFELLCANLFTASVEPVEKALRDAKLDKSAIHEVVLVGGSSRIPKIQQLLSSMFGGKMLNKGVNPDEAVAYGAAIQAAISSDVKSNLIKDLLFIDVTPISLGVETDGGVMTTIVNRNTTISTKASLTVPIRCDAESGWQIKIYEGEHAMTKDNNLIGKFGFRCTEHRKDSATGFLANIGLGGLMPRTQPNEHQIEVTFDIHADGTITVSAKDSKSKYDLKHTISCSRLTDWETRRIRDEISTMIANEDQPTNDEIADLHAEISQLKEQNSDLWQQLEAQKNQHNGKEVDDDEKRQLKDELEEVKRKYRKLLMMVGRQDTK